MQAYRVETVVQVDGSLILQNLPFSVGEPVEVIVLPQSAAQPKTESRSLRGLPIIYHQDPFAPAVPEEDWEALR